MGNSSTLTIAQGNLRELKKAARAHLQNIIIPFWEGLRDAEYGGYYGYVDHELKVKPDAVKGCILNSRILWFFSNASLTLKSDEYLPYAQSAYEFLRKYCMDYECGGVFWSVTYDGKVEDGTKHVYNQAFAIYALSSYYDAVRDDSVLKMAWDLYHLIENRCRDEKGYLEAFTRDFTPIDNEQLSENGVLAYRTMNTLLHVFEAYTELYRVTKDKQVGMRIKEILETFETHVYNPVLIRQEVFFDENWNSIIDLHSYGHDIEASWLLDLGCRILDGDERNGKIGLMTAAMAKQVHSLAYHDHSIWYEREHGVENKTRIWWVQAEAVVGFFNAWKNTPDTTIFLEAVYDIWNYIMENVVDPRKGSEWFQELNQDGEPDACKPIVDSWKCPYHNGRMCLELIKRIDDGGDD